ncbi:sterol regulatory element-binding protein cleavage-activating protein [Parachaetomium inaequale]|uniref:Sterol regulatory element-binding protein cleavage-activating protein n=1 Tax=Parachaetomium inaequale TaxID=2588326 RepID=A0AAN6PAN4_9PEZI|nr:sterol regulatory element-binding protein cleavage-activating protein [Parachaetomium inaequale]
MLWYLLYPLRGTTEAPVLAPAHPLRRLFSRYGTWAARHVKTVLPLSGAVVFIFLYLFPFLYTTDAANITSGVSHLPHHVWTDAQPLRDGAVVEPDVVMRSIWVHGSYMKALERDVLLGALELQDEILGPTTDFNPRQAPGPPVLPDPDADLDRQQRDAFHIINGLTSQSWFFHSPLQYWSCSADNIAADQDLVTTVNEKKTQSTSVNTTLRHSIVFSGKRFEERQLVAADALVITLLHLRDSPVGRQWVKKAEALAQAQAAKLDRKWQIIPPDGRSTSNQLYQFQFQPMSWYDWVMLTLAYSLTISNLLLRLSKLRAVKSRLGLMVTILAQIAASIVSSFSVCAIFKIDLSRVPHYAYPLVMLAISMENSFRLINAVIMTSSTISISNRIGEAFGATAHIAIANRVQNSLILYGLSKITSSGVSAFCTFAAIATLFDFFYLATFFLTVLSVDVRQRELWELEKASLKGAKPSHGGLPRPLWVDGIYPIRLGETAMSTRIAGTIVLVGFVLIVQAHYTSEGGRQWLNKLFSLSWRDAGSTPKSSLLIDIHQARSPTSWLRLQDHETAREVIKVVKPWAHSYVARVYDPIIFVLKGADRTPDTREPLFLPAVYDFVHHQIPRFVVSLLTMLAALRLFTNHLIKDQAKDGAGPDHPDDEPLLSVQSLTKGHTLDVAILTASPSGQLVSVGLDRAIQVWDVPSGSRTRVLSDSEVPLENPFPVLDMALDDNSKWLALVSWQRVFLWNIEKQQWAGTRDIDLGGHRPEAVFFVTKTPYAAPSLILVRRNGVGLEMRMETEDSRDFVICKTPLVWAVSFTEKCNSQQQTPPIAILTASRKSCIHLVRQQNTEWLSTEVKLEGDPGAGGIHCLLPIPALSKYLVGRSQSVDLVDFDSSTVVHTFHTETMQPRTLKQISLSRAPQPGVTSLTLSYTSAETGDLVAHTYLPETENDATTPLSPVAPGPHDPWSLTKEVTKRITNPGAWEALPSGSIVGVRRRQTTASPPTTASSPIAGLRRRTAHALSPNNNKTHPNNSTSSTTQQKHQQQRGWEAWVLDLRPDTKSDFETRPLDEADSGSHLMISELGPMTRLGAMSVAVGLGDVVKVVSAGHEYFDRGRDGSLGMGGFGSGEGMQLQFQLQQVMGVGTRRKKGSGGGPGRASAGGGRGRRWSAN